MDPIKQLLWKWLEPEIEAAITRRILLFHDAMVEREQIPAITDDYHPAVYEQRPH